MSPCGNCNDEKDSEETLHISSSPESEEADDGISWKEKLSENKWVKLSLFLISVVNGLVSVIFDWIWVNDMATATKALVFGPPGRAAFGLLCFIASVGTVSVLTEITGELLRYFLDREPIPDVVGQLCSLFLEEVPQITLNLLLASCREVPTNWVAMAKAVIVMISSAIRILKVLCFMCGCGKRKVKHRFSCVFIVARWIILGTCCYTFAAAILTWMFTYSTPPPIIDEDGDSGFLPPAGVWGKNYHSERYFANAGVFFRHPHFAHCNHGIQATTIHENVTETVNRNWIRVEHIYTYISLEEATPDLIDMVYAYNVSHSQFWIKAPEEETCFQIALDTCDIQMIANDTFCLENLNSFQTILSSRFIYVERSKTLVFGDIQYNALITTDNKCTYLDSDEWGFLHDHHGNQYGQLQYFRAKSTVNTSFPFHQSDNGSFHYYQYEDDYFKSGDLYNVSGVWKTGHNQCQMSGSPCPNLNPEIQVPCSSIADNVTSSASFLLHPNRYHRYSRIVWFLLLRIYADLCYMV